MEKLPYVNFELTNVKQAVPGALTSAPLDLSSENLILVNSGKHLTNTQIN
jgi:hypothetical protein